METLTALAEALRKDFLAAWQEHGRTALDIMAKEDTVNFVKIMVSQLPRQTEVEKADAMTDDERRNRIRGLLNELGLAVTIGEGGRIAASAGGEGPGSGSH